MRRLTALGLLIPLCGALLGCPLLAHFDYYVDAVNGDDVNPGTIDLPFKSISAALAVATNGQAISVAPGTYDTANGESFPLDLAPGMSLIGDEANKGDGAMATSIVGDGGTVLLADSNAVIAGFVITAAAGPSTGVDIAYSGVTLRNDTIRGHETYGVLVHSGASALTITDNVIRDNGPAAGTTGTGLAFLGGGAGSQVQDNTISANGIGIELDTADVDLGGGSTRSRGRNAIFCNRGNDLVSGSVAVSAHDDQWDDVPPSEAASAGDGGDLLADDPQGVDVAGASLAASTCPFYDVYVSAGSGNDANPGTQSQPLKTIGAGLAAAAADETVKVAPGTYDTGNGESFPLFVPDDVTLLGDPRSRGHTRPFTRIYGGGSIGGAALSAAVQLGNGATLRGFEVTNRANLATNDVGVSVGYPAVTGDGARLLDNAIVDSRDNGIDVRNADALEISGNLVESNDLNGIFFLDGGRDSVLTDNEVRSNVFNGVIFQATAGSLDGDAVTLSPGNVLACNLFADLSVGAAGTLAVDASGNAWDHVPPTQSAALKADVVHGTNTSYDVSGASLAANRCK